MPVHALHRKMVENAWKWADEQPGRKRINPIHKEEEIKLVLKDTFVWMEEEGDTTALEGDLEMEDLYLNMGNYIACSIRAHTHTYTHTLTLMIVHVQHIIDKS